ncbi:MAG: PHP domain-containing protein, partial [Cellulomonadaceae bacterium]|nr:PHP domain-containing protein [Cellulomonadaceae bacterium]
MSSPAYAELHAHSAFSFLDGASQPEEMVAEAARLGLSALAITDHNGLYGAVRHAKAAAEQGLSAVFGAELSLAVAATASGSAQNRVETVATLEDRTGTPDPKAQHLLVLARGPSGYKQLSSAIGLAHLASEAKARVEFSVEQLGAQAKGEWLVLAGCRKGAVRQALTGGGVAAARVELDRLMALFGAENVAVELPVPSSPAIGALHGALAGLAAEMRLPTVATTGAHYARPAQAPLAQALAAIRANSSLPTFEGFLPSPSAHLRSPAEMSRLFASFPQAVATAAALGKECSFDLRLVAPSLPPYPVP